MPLLATERIDQAVADVFSIMLGLACTPAAEHPLPPDALMASVAFSGCVRGACIISLERHTAELLTEIMLGLAPQTLPIDEQCNLLADTVGELCNMIAGGWKSRLHEGYACCALAPPVILGSSTLERAHTAARLSRCYNLFGNHVEVELNFEPTIAAP